eukprot:5497383-Pyramimonas_sp.AAC.1
MAEWVATQVQRGLCPSAVAQHQCDSLLMKISNLYQITTDEATALVKTIRECSLNNWTPEQRTLVPERRGQDRHVANARRAQAVARY